MTGDDALAGKLKQHSAYFDAMVNLVPPKHYFPSVAAPDAWKSRFQRSAPDRLAARKKARAMEKLRKRGRYDPELEDTVVARQRMGRADGQALLPEDAGDDAPSLKERLHERLEQLRNKRTREERGEGAPPRKRAKRAEKREKREKPSKAERAGAKGKGKDASAVGGGKDAAAAKGKGNRKSEAAAAAGEAAAAAGTGALDLKFSKFDFTPASTSKTLMKRDEKLRKGALKARKGHNASDLPIGAIARGPTQGARRVAKATAMLAEAEAKRDRLDKLKEKGDTDAVAASGLRDATLRAAGESVRDDPRLIKKTLKREMRAREKSSQAWKARTAGVAKTMTERQDRRKENLRRRKDGEKTIRKTSSKKRAGFEGKKKQFLNKPSPGGK
eukprot:TRINITY_DN6651_c3_g1_i1.p1 TRINITY_DN6651_c3_g1~~TRINITY_DN6651_c3_g1_i1.p1  ORF type:complete len:387 (-),score=170.81 TRINITY_DN6651_c3_g1_i1:75-1235(-)